MTTTTLKSQTYHHPTSGETYIITRHDDGQRIAELRDIESGALKPEDGRLVHQLLLAYGELPDHVLCDALSRRGEHAAHGAPAPSSVMLGPVPMIGDPPVPCDPVSREPLTDDLIADWVSNLGREELDDAHVDALRAHAGA